MKPSIPLLSLVSRLLFAVPAPANEFFAMDNSLGDVKPMTAGDARQVERNGPHHP